MQITQEAIVIRERSIGEDDRLLTLLCRQEGVITAYARGAQKMKSTLGPSCGLLAYSTFQLFHSRERYIVDRADTINLFFGLRQDIEKLALASYLAEVACVTAPSGQDSEAFLRLLLNCLHFLEKGAFAPVFIKPVFELRCLAMSGFMPDLVACCGCGCYEAEKMYLAVNDGTLWCGECVSGPEAKYMALTPGVLAAMRHVIYSELPKLFSFRLSDEGIRYLGRVCEAYFLAQMGQGFQTLDFYHSLSGMEAWAAANLPDRAKEILTKGGEDI
ncbi:MAG: DNA repair protein RecO [Oscillospiraceae bacterium]|nr:DNA repair protein RecO [Oscillospiraceae bacterium]